MNINDQNYEYYFRKFLNNKSLSIDNFCYCISLIVDNNNHILFKKIIKDERFNIDFENYYCLSQSLSLGHHKIVNLILNNFEINENMKKIILDRTPRILKNRDLKTLSIVYDFVNFKFYFPKNNFYSRIAFYNLFDNEPELNIIEYIFNNSCFVLEYKMIEEILLEMIENNLNSKIISLFFILEDFIKQFKIKQKEHFEKLEEFNSLKKNINSF